MDALILSCGTGGGHNSAGRAIQEELCARGHRVRMLNPYTLQSDALAGRIDRLYVRTAQRAPRAFGAIYRAGELYRKLPLRSPVYYANRGMLGAMEDYLRENRFDIIIMPHLFPAEILTNMKRQGLKIPKTMFVATDYCCIPFTEETDCDAYVIPSADLRQEYAVRGIPEERLYPLGIPVGRSFEEVCRDCAVAPGERRPETAGDGSYILISGGSMGAGRIEELVRLLLAHEGIRGKNGTADGNKDDDKDNNKGNNTENDKDNKDGGADKKSVNRKIVVVCGNNRELYDRLKKRYGRQIIVVGHTDCMADYMRACDLYITKPGGLSSTEAAVCGVPLVHMPPIPGCETFNAAYFRERNMSISCRITEKGAEEIFALLEDQKARRAMRACQGEAVQRGAAGRICTLAEQLAWEPEGRQEPVFRFQMGA